MKKSYLLSTLLVITIASSYRTHATFSQTGNSGSTQTSSSFYETSSFRPNENIEDSDLEQELPPLYNQGFDDEYDDLALNKRKKKRKIKDEHNTITHNDQPHKKRRSNTCDKNLLNSPGIPNSPFFPNPNNNSFNPLNNLYPKNSNNLYAHTYNNTNNNNNNNTPLNIQASPLLLSLHNNTLTNPPQQFPMNNITPLYSSLQPSNNLFPSPSINNNPTNPSTFSNQSSTSLKPISQDTATLACLMCINQKKCFPSYIYTRKEYQKHLDEGCHHGQLFYAPIEIAPLEEEIKKDLQNKKKTTPTPILGGAAFLQEQKMSGAIFHKDEKKLFPTLPGDATQIEKPTQTLNTRTLLPNFNQPNKKKKKKPSPKEEASKLLTFSQFKEIHSKNSTYTPLTTQPHQHLPLKKEKHEKKESKKKKKTSINLIPKKKKKIKKHNVPKHFDFSFVKRKKKKTS